MGATPGTFKAKIASVAQLPVRPQLMAMERKTQFNLGYLIFALLAMVLVQQWWQRVQTVEVVPYSEFEQLLGQDKIAEVTVSDQHITGKLKSPEKGKSIVVANLVPPEVAERLSKYGVKYTRVQESTFLRDLLSWIVPALVFFGIWFLLVRRMSNQAGGGLGGFMAIGKSRARIYVENKTGVSFKDVAGVEEAKAELQEVVDFLKDPKKYGRLGARVPKGVLLVGPPGTGKTLLARAVAGEAGVAFFSISGAEFVEMFVGVGAARVRDLFEQARQKAPAIIFIDELDALGRARGAGGIGGHDEREQTLNQLLVELDGFDPSTGLVLLAATNRPEILDSALLRPGRFDRRVVVSPPDQVGRQQILEVHTRSVPLDEDVDLSALASTTPGMVGADLKNLVNEAALLAARREHDRVALADFTDSLEKIILGTERRLVLSQDERERTAYHESGHALLGMLQPGADPVRKISIVPRGSALGVTFQSPEADRYSYEKKYLRGRIIGMLGGRAAEELVYDEVTTGAANDLERVSQIARQMVGRWGMSDVIGPVSVLPSSGSDMPWMENSDGPSAATRELVDQEARRIIEDCYADAMRVLRENRNKLDALAQALLIRETLDEADAYRIAGVVRAPKPALL